MTVYKIDVQYNLNTEYWTNVFYINAATIAVAKGWVDDYVAETQDMVQNAVTIDKARLTPAPFTANTFSDYPINLPGTGGATAPAPLFNVVRQVWGKSVGRGVSHYFRGGVTPSNIGADGNFTSGAQTFNESKADGIGVLVPGVCDRNGDLYLTFTASPKVGMRQLRRGSRRSTTPVI